MGGKSIERNLNRDSTTVGPTDGDKIAVVAELRTMQHILSELLKTQQLLLLAFQETFSVDPREGDIKLED